MANNGNTWTGNQYQPVFEPVRAASLLGYKPKTAQSFQVPAPAAPIPVAASAGSSASTAQSAGGSRPTISAKDFSFFEQLPGVMRKSLGGMVRKYYDVV